MDSLWVEPTVDGKDSVGKLKSGHLNIDRVKQLVAEFVTTLSPDEWVTNPLLVYKVYYGSKVPATPLNYKATYYPELWGYEVSAKWGYGREMPCIVLKVENFFRSRYYGIAYREIWLPTQRLLDILQKMHPSINFGQAKMEWDRLAQMSYGKEDEHLKSFTCSLRNIGNATTAFKMGFNEKSELVNG